MVMMVKGDKPKCVRNLSIGKVSFRTVKSLVREVAYGSDARATLPVSGVITDLERELEIPVITRIQASI